MDKDQIEKVKKGLECCTRSHQTIRQNMCDECPYKNKGVMNAFTVWKTCINALAEDALKLINELQATAEPKWIPVSEHLPKQEQIPFDCLIALKSGTVCEATFLDVDPVHRWCTELHYFNTGDVIAWMPLPEPPKEGE